MYTKNTTIIVLAALLVVVGTITATHTVQARHGWGAAGSAIGGFIGHACCGPIGGLIGGYLGDKAEDSLNNGGYDNNDG